MKVGILGKALVAAAAVGTVNAATPAQWRSRSIYQVLTDRFARTDGSTTAACDTGAAKYCGGTWQGIIKQLDYIQNMGFTAIWISPVTYNIPEWTKWGEAYHGYWQEDLYRLNDEFGTAEDLRALSKALHDRDMYLMVDIVINHNGWNGSSASVDYSRFHPFNDRKFFHDPCTINYDDQASIEKCWIGDDDVALPDLRTEDQAVRDEYGTWIKELVSNYSIDGLRIDTAKHVDKTILSSLNQASGVFNTGEVLNGDAAYTCGYQYSMDSVLNYPVYYPIRDFLSSTSGTSASLLQAIQTLKTDCKDVSLLGTFTENHDQPRWGSLTSDTSLAKNALALTLLWDGIPIVYAGQEQHFTGALDLANREATWLAKYSRESELYKLTASTNQVRNHAAFIDSNYLMYNIQSIQSDANTVALRKGHDGKQIVSVFTNKGSNAGSSTLDLKNHGWDAGTAVIEVLTCDQLTVSGDGTLAVPMAGGVPRIYFSAAAASGSGICGA